MFKCCAAVIAFHKQHYSSERMKLAVMGRESLDDLQALVESLFASVSVQGVFSPLSCYCLHILQSQKALSCCFVLCHLLGQQVKQRFSM